jgi:hypothetical protein
MSLLDQFKQTLGEAAGHALDAGQNLGAQAAAQLQIKRLQLEAAKKTHDLGARVYEWHRSGTLVATGTVPRDVSELCHALDDLHGQLRAEEEKLEAARREAEEAKRRALEARDARHTAPRITVESEATDAVAPQQPTSNQTQILSESTMSPATTNATAITPHITAIGPSIPGPAMPGLPAMPRPDTPFPGSNPDLPSHGISVPGPDSPGTPGHQTPNPDLPPSMPGTPTLPPMPGEPTMPGQPL